MQAEKNKELESKLASAKKTGGADRHRDIFDDLIDDNKEPNCKKVKTSEEVDRIGVAEVKSAPLNNKDSSMSGIKRHKKVSRDNIQGITNKSIRRLARCAGFKSILDINYEEVRNVLKVFLENVIRDAVTYTENEKRKTVKAMDVVYAFKRQSRPICAILVNKSQPETENKS